MLICRLVFQGHACKRGATPENSKSNNSSKFHATITNAPKQPWFHHIGPLLEKCWKTLTTINTCACKVPMYLLFHLEVGIPCQVPLSPKSQMIIRIGLHNAEEKDDMLVFETLLLFGINVLHVCFGPFMAFLNFQQHH